MLVIKITIVIIENIGTYNLVDTNSMFQKLLNHSQKLISLNRAKASFPMVVCLPGVALGLPVRSADWAEIFHAVFIFVWSLAVRQLRTSTDQRKCKCLIKALALVWPLVDIDAM